MMRTAKTGIVRVVAGHEKCRVVDCDVHARQRFLAKSSFLLCDALTHVSIFTRSCTFDPVLTGSRQDGP